VENCEAEQMSLHQIRPDSTRPDITNAAVKRIDKKIDLAEGVIGDIKRLNNAEKLRAEMYYDGRAVKELSNYIEHLLNIKRSK
jgi:hypothetical protein